MSDAKGIRIPLTISKDESVAQVGVALQYLGRSLGNAVTNQFAQDPADYDVDVVVTMRKIESH